MTRLATLSAAALVLAACGSADLLGVSGDPLLSGGDAPIRTDSSVYHLRTTPEAHELTIGVRFVNPTSAPAYIPTCQGTNPPTLERWDGEKWVTAFSPVVLLCLGPPVVIGAGESYDYTFRVLASRRPNTYPRFEVAEIPGTYRLVWGILGSWRPDGPEPGIGDPLPLAQRVSNTFTIAK